jgi:WD40 repeat protein
MDASSGQIIHEFEGHTAGVTGVAFSKDGKILVSASEATDGSIRFWDISSGSLLRSLKLNTQYGAPQLAVSPDGSKLAAAWYQNVRVWDFDTGTVLMDGASADCMPQFSKDGSLMAVFGSEDRSSIAVYDTSDWKPVLKFAIPAQTLQLALSPDGKILATGGENSNQTIHFWDISTGKELGHIDDNLQPLAMVFSPDGSVLAVGGLLKSSKVSIPLKILSLYDPTTRQRISELRAPSVSPRLLAMAPDGRQFATIDMGGTVGIWGPASDQIASARQVLLTYLDDLNQAKYSDAAGLYYSDRVEANSPDYQFLKKSHPKLDLNNIQGVLQAVCEDKRFPCAKFRDIVYQGSFVGNGISFYIEYTAPDGSALVSPIPCSAIPSTCEPVTAFLFNLMPGSDGSYKVTSLPPAAEFP